jgi:outer membrane protein TolC
MLLHSCSLPYEPRRQYTVCPNHYPRIYSSYPSPCPVKVIAEKTDRKATNSPINLEQVVEIALQDNPDVDQALARIRQAEATIGEVNAEFLPIITTNTTFIRADAPSIYLFKKIDEREFNPATNFNYPGPLSNFETDLSLRYNVYKGGISVLNRWKAERGLDIRCLDRETLNNFLTASVIEAYYNCLALQEAVEKLVDTCDMIAKQLQVVRDRYEEGMLLKSDLLFLEVRLAEAEEKIILANNSFRLALASLSNLIGGNADTELTLVRDDVDWIPVPENYESALGLALCLRPELKVARKHVEVAEIDVGISRRAFLPTVDVDGRVYWDDEQMQYSLSRTNWMVGVGFSWSLYDGGAKTYTVSKAHSLLDELLAQDRKITLSIQLDIKQSYLNYESANAHLLTADKALEHSTQNLATVNEQYLEGTRSVSDYLGAQIMYTTSLLSKIQAVYDIKKAKAAIARSVGLFASGLEEK